QLTVIDTPGFGDQLNREENLQPIVQYIDAQFDAYLQAERSSEYRKAIPDTRVHTLLYFIPPTGHSLKELDILSLRTLAGKVNVIPVIAKADTLTPEEKVGFKQSILRDLQYHQVPFYPSGISDERGQYADLEPYFPFTVIGSDRIVQVEGGRMTRGRTYRWGVVTVDNEEHCDFIHLRRMIMDTCLADLLETTHTFHYAAYRAQQLRSNGRRESILACDEAYETRVEATKQSLKEEMTRKEEEIRLMFVNRVREKEVLLREREETLVGKREQWMRELEEERRQLEMEEREVDALLGNRNML
ncbi:Septin-domain-containing protein, partial [Piptocephalis cylindrospora]